MLHFPKYSHTEAVVGLSFNGVVLPSKHHIVRRQDPYLWLDYIYQNQEPGELIVNQVTQFITHIYLQTEIFLYNSRHFSCLQLTLIFGLQEFPLAIQILI